MIDKEAYDEKYSAMVVEIEKLNGEKESLSNHNDRDKNIKKRLSDFRKVLSENDILPEFDRAVFESIIEKVIVGGYDEDGNEDPSMLSFVYKTGFSNTINSSKYRPQRKNAKENNKLCTFTANEDNILLQQRYRHMWSV